MVNLAAGRGSSRNVVDMVRIDSIRSHSDVRAAIGGRTSNRCNATFTRLPATIRKANSIGILRPRNDSPTNDRRGADMNRLSAELGLLLISNGLQNGRPGLATEVTRPVDGLARRCIRYLNSTKCFRGTGHKSSWKLF
jgi:hypothetical protein